MRIHRLLFLVGWMMFLYANIIRADESERILRVQDGDFSGVFFVSMFDGVVPLPSTYVLRANATHTELSTLPYPKKTDELGTVFIALFADIYTSGLLSEEDIAWKRTVERAGLIIEIMAVKNPVLGGAYPVALIHDGTDAILLVGDGSALWEAMVTAYSFLRDRDVR